MNRSWVLLGTTAAFFGASLAAAGADNTSNPRRPASSPPSRNPPSWTPPARKANPPPNTAPRAAAPAGGPYAAAAAMQAARRPPDSDWRRHHGTRVLVWPYGYNPYSNGGYWPNSGYPYPSWSNDASWGYSPYGDYSYGAPYAYGGLPYAPPMGSFYGPFWRPFYPAAVFMPAEQLFGPGPIMRLMGVEHWFNHSQPALAGGGQAAVARAQDRDAHRAAPRDAGLPPAAGAKATETAWKLLSFGDAHFANRKYADALERYRRAGQAAPQVADACFREGFAEAALGHYDRAAKAIRHGLDLQPNWAGSNFRLDELFGDDALAKKNQIDAMLKRAEANPGDSNVALLLGLSYYFDGKAERAAPFLRQAAEQGGNAAAMKGFLAAKE